MLVKKVLFNSATLLCVLFWVFNSKAEVNVCSAVKSSTVQRCPMSRSEYKVASMMMNCRAFCGPGYHYHCIRDNKHKHLHNLCAKNTKIIGHCAVYDITGQVVQNDYTVPYQYKACSGRVYINSSDIYKYPHCLHTASMDIDRGRDLERPHHRCTDSDDGISLPIFIIAIVCAYVIGSVLSLLCYEKISAFRRVTRCFFCQGTDDRSNVSGTTNHLIGQESREENGL